MLNQTLSRLVPCTESCIICFAGYRLSVVVRIMMYTSVQRQLMRTKHVYVRTVLSHLRETNLTVSPSKSELLLRCRTSKTVLANPAMQKHCEDVLRTKSGVRAIFGMLGCHRAVVPKYAEIT